MSGSGLPTGGTLGLLSGMAPGVSSGGGAVSLVSAIRLVGGFCCMGAGFLWVEWGTPRLVVRQPYW
ncbi:hypothetical protein BIV25_35490 [Streptomyces sp. MUSC 14]|nr:hypothetical protein BIV25_35490 [Streptomyces sp. MUSC 14]